MMTLAFPHMTISLEMKGMKKEAILETRVTKVQSHRESEGDLTKCVFNSYDSVLPWFRTVLTVYDVTTGGI